MWARQMQFLKILPADREFPYIMDSTITSFDAETYETAGSMPFTQS